MLLCCWRTRGTRGEEDGLCQSLQLKMGIQQGPKNWEHLGTTQEGDDGREAWGEEEEQLKIQTKPSHMSDMVATQLWHVHEGLVVDHRCWRVMWLQTEAADELWSVYIYTVCLFTSRWILQGWNDGISQCKKTTEPKLKVRGIIP